MVSRRRRSVGSAVFTVFAVVAFCHAVCAADGSDEYAVPPPPPIDTELSRVKNVSIIRIEENDADEDIWDHQASFWRFKQHHRRFGRLRIKDETLLEVLCSEAHVSPLHVFGGQYLPDGRYNLTLKGVPEDDSRLYAVDELCRAFEASFDLSIVRETREIPVLTLQTDSGGLELLKKSLDSTSDSDGSQSISTSSDGGGVTEVEYQGSLSSFAEYLEEELGEAVVNGVQLSGRISLHFDHETVPGVDDSDYGFFSPATLVELRRRRLEDIDNGLHKYGLALVRTRQRLKGIFITQGRPEQGTTPAATPKQIAGASRK